MKRLLPLVLIFAITMAACSRSGVRMPKHRKRTNCDCPTFSEVTPSTPSTTLAYGE